MSILFHFFFTVILVLSLFKLFFYSFHHKSINSEDFVRWLQNWQWNLAQGAGTQLPEDIPDYKFYSVLAKQCIGLAREFGSLPKELLIEWREAAEKESQHDVRWKDSFNSSVGQFLLFSVITWIFYFLSHSILEANTNLITIFLILFLQTLGFIFYTFFRSYFYHKNLLVYSDLLERLYKFRSLSKSGLPTSRIVSLLQDKKLNHPIADKLEKLIQKLKDTGPQVLMEVPGLIQETWFMRDRELQKLEKRSLFLKFIVLLCFFGGGWFVMIVNMILFLWSKL